MTNVTNVEACRTMSMPLFTLEDLEAAVPLVRTIAASKTLRTA